MEFTLLNPNEIYGDQLVDEIKLATGIDVSNRYSFIPPTTVVIVGADIDVVAVEIQAVIDSHAPDLLYFPEDRQKAEDAILESTARTGWKDLGNWSTWQPQQAQDYVNAEILNGMDNDQINAWIDANVTGSNTAQLRAQVVAALKVIAGNIITLRNIVGIIAKVILYIRDILIKRL